MDSLEQKMGAEDPHHGKTQDPRADLKASWEKTYKAAMGSSDVSSLREALKFFYELHQLKDAQTVQDELTGIWNKLGFEHHVDHALKHAQKPGYRGGSVVGVVDIGTFKKINDAYGHLHGDRLLVRIAEFLDLRLRAGDVVGRLHGDEFGLLLTDVEEYDILTRRLEERVRQYGEFVRDLDPFGYTAIDVGLTALQPQDTSSSARHRADDAMYFAKNLRKAGVGSGIHFFDPSKLYETRQKRD